MVRIFLSDSQQIIREGLKLILKEVSDFEVVAEAHTYDGITERLDKVKCDIVMLDLDMFGKRGIETIHFIKKNYPSVYVLALSVHPEDKHALRYLKAGASGYLSKSNVYEELVAAIKKISTRGRYLSQSLAELLAFDVFSDKQSKPHEMLSSRELETFYHLTTGKKVKDIADELALSISTVFTYRVRIFEKLKIKTNVELLHYALDNDLFDLKANSN